MSKFRLIRLFGQMFLLLILLGSCTPSKYFSHYSYLADSLMVNQLVVTPPEQYKLQKGDRIKINVTALNPLAAQQFNMVITETTPGLGLSSSGLINPDATGYLLDNSGTIVFPQLGHVYVEGMTTDSVANLLEHKLSQYLTNPAISVTHVNFIINVLGEVAHPGPMNLPEGQNSLLKVISRAGDLTTFGKRENILIIREKNSKREFGNVDLSSKNLFKSPYYYLEPGDLVYVDANVNKLLGADAYNERRISLISLTFATISTALLLINFFK